MAEIKRAIDIYILYRIIKDLSTPFNEMEAFKLGLIDSDGKRLKKAGSKEEKDAVSYYNRFILNLKRLMSKVGLGGRVATFAAALFLLKEHTSQSHSLTEETFVDEDGVLTEIVATMKYLENNTQKNFRQLEEEIANVTGAAVAGTGDDPVHWKKMPYKVGLKGERKRKGRYINGVAYLKKIAKEAAKKQGD
jgi:hypothetical protein